MPILLIGLNHRTAPVTLREQLAFTRDGVATALLLFRNRFPQTEAALLSTCNRVEILVASDADSPTTADVVSFLAQARDLPVSHFRPHLYQLTGEQAVRHFFRVASGLDSMVLGESQIVDQVKQAYALAAEQGTTGRVLNRLFHNAFKVSKRVRSETRIGQGHCSVSSVAVDIARDIFDDFASKRTLVVGAGEMARLVCQSLRDADARDFVVTTRTLANAKSLADACHGAAVPFAALDDQLARADIVITATACPQPFISVDRVRTARAASPRRGRPLFIIDLAVPRNVHPDVATLDSVYLYDVDALGRIAAENRSLRHAQLESCERILDEEIADFQSWLSHARISPLIQQIYSTATALRDQELTRLLHRLPADLPPESRDEIARTLDRLTNKLIHPSITTLRHHTTLATTLAQAWHPTATPNSPPLPSPQLGTRN